MMKFSKRSLIFIMLCFLIICSGAYIALRFIAKPQDEISANSLNTPDTTPTVQSSSPSVAPTALWPDDNRFHLFELKKSGSNEYTYNGILFKTDQEGALYMQKSNNDFIRICDSQKKQNTNTNNNINFDMYSRHKESIDKLLGTYLTGTNYTEYICRYEGYDYFELLSMCGGGSGEFWGGPDSGFYFGVNIETGEIKDFGDFRAGYCKEKENWVYYLDVINVDQERAKNFPGIYEGDIIGVGYLSRMRPDGSDKQLLSMDVASGMFHMYDNKIYYKSYRDKKLRVISEDGKEKFVYRNEIDWYDEIYDKIEVYGHFILIRREYDDNNNFCLTDRFTDIKEIILPDRSEYYYTDVITWDEHSLLISAYRGDCKPDDNILYLYSDLKLGQY